MNLELARCEIERIEAKITKLVQDRQIHRADFVEICLSLDAVKRSLTNDAQEERDARELATVEQLQHATAISARMVHESFIHAEPTATKWEEVSDAQKARYEVMASRLNGYLLDAIRLHVACLESDQDDYEVHITPEARRESQAWKAAAALATEHACNWSAEAQEAGVEDSKDE